MIAKIKKYSTTNTLVILGIILGVAFGSFFPRTCLTTTSCRTDIYKLFKDACSAFSVF
ncbi:MAG: hypothetical protein Q9M43_02320 [Sulfurimonas sp.]|nr:hypothetical protein [Sulfurimonas sp.]